MIRSTIFRLICSLLHNVLIGKFSNPYYNIVTIVFEGIHCDLDEEQVPENGIFWRISFII